MIIRKRLNKQLLSFVTTVCFFLPSFAHADAALEANQLLQFFAAGCPTQGQWTQAAQNYANNLVVTLKTLATDPDCRTLNGALSSAQGLSTLLNTLVQDENQRQLISLRQQQQELLLMISNATNTAEVGLLVPQLQSTNVRIAEYEGYAAADKPYTNLQQQGKTLQTLVTGTQAVLQQATQNVTCLQRNPGILPALAGLSGAVSSVALTGGASLLVGAGAEIMNSVVSTVRDMRIARKINKMASSLTQTAYQCVLESLSNQWCASQDALEIITLKGRSITRNDQVTPIERGIRLLDRDSMIFLNWLQTIQAGTEPTNQAVASRQALVLDRNRLVQAARVNGLGMIAEAEKIFNTRGDDEARWNIELQTIKTLVESFTTMVCTSNPCPTSPLSDAFGSAAAEVAPWFLIGVADSQIPREMGSRRSLYNYSYSELVAFLNRQPPFKPDLKDLQERMLLWVSLARERVNAEMNITLNLDPLRLVNDAATQKLDGTSPYRSLLNIIRFLREQRPTMGASTGSFQFLYNDTIARLEAVQGVIESIVSSTSPLVGGDISTAISTIYNQAVLDNGTGFISGRLMWALRLALNDMVIRPGHGGTTASQAAVLLATNDIVQQLESYTPGAYLNGSNLNKIARDIKKSQSIIENTINVFTDEFGPGIERSMLRLSALATAKGEAAGGSNNQEISEFCLELLASPVWPKGVNPQICMGRTLDSIFGTGVTTQAFSRELMNSPYAARVCTYRDYHRRNQLFQYFESRDDR